VLRILARQAAEEVAHAVALLQHHAPADQDDPHPLDQVAGLVDRRVGPEARAPEQRRDLDERQRQRQRDQRVEHDDRPPIEE